MGRLTITIPAAELRLKCSACLREVVAIPEDRPKLVSTKIGRPVIEKRSRELTQALLAGMRKIDGVKIWTSPEPSRTVAVVSLQPGSLDARKLAAALYQKERIGCATRGGQDRPGVRFSPHFYNTHADIERTVAAVKKYMASGV